MQVTCQRTIENTRADSLATIWQILAASCCDPYKIIYSGSLEAAGNGRIWLIPLVGAGRFELPTPCAQDRCATRLRYAPTGIALSFYAKPPRQNVNRVCSSSRRLFAASEKPVPPRLVEPAGWFA